MRAGFRFDRDSYRENVNFNDYWFKNALADKS